MIKIQENKNRAFIESFLIAFFAEKRTKFIE